MTIIEFKAPDQHDPHLSGEAICTACKHEWMVVAPVGTTEHECPSCGTFSGLLKYPVMPSTRWQCNCGNELFFIMPDGCMCRACGQIANL